MEHDADTNRALAAFAEAVFVRFDSRNGTAEACGLLGIHRNESWVLLYDGSGQQVVRLRSPKTSGLFLEVLAELAQGQTPRLTRFALSYAIPSSEDVRLLEEQLLAYQEGAGEEALSARQALIEAGLPALRALRGLRIEDPKRPPELLELQQELEQLQEVVEQHGMHTNFRLLETLSHADQRAAARLQAILPLETDLEAFVAGMEQRSPRYRWNSSRERYVCTRQGD